MWADIFIASLWGGIVAIDTTALMQIMISRPMMACSVVGLLLGNFPLGFVMGFLVELLYISELPIGAAKFAEGNVGSTAAATLAILTTRQLPQHYFMSIALALILFVPLSSLGGRLVLLKRKINGVIYERLIYRDLLAPRQINAAQLYGILLSFLVGFITLTISSILFVSGATWLLSRIPATYDKIFQPAMGGVLAAGCVFLAHLFWKQHRKKWVLFIGLGLGLILFVKYL
ncbi:PTS sugar transporter subunit IIC [candidate division KSB1 bacterium]|nr:PTS sugar transporter subunit IIC [candidate division KSB1 bacterium]